LILVIDREISLSGGYQGLVDLDKGLGEVNIHIVNGTLDLSVFVAKIGFIQIF